MIGDKSYYWHILLSNTTRLHCKQWQLRISPESISLTLQPVIVSSLNFLVLLHIYKKAKLYFRIVHSQRDHFNCKKKKKKACCNGNPVYISYTARELVQESGRERKSDNIPFYKSLAI